MLKKILVLMFLACSFFGYAQVYQLPNGGFEEWETVSGNGKTGDEPLHWNSFITASGQLATAGANQIYESTDVRPGTTGTKSIKTTARDVIFGIIANGAFTTGQVNMGSVSMDNPANHNITRTAQPDFRQPLNAKPDSIVFWAKFLCPSATQQARMSAIIHDNYDYMDPDSYNPEAPAHKVGGAVLNFLTGSGSWVRYSVPFDYNFPATTPEYILITFSTNAVAGAGSVNDDLFVDDIEFIYNVNLSDLQIDGTTVTGFDANVLNYNFTTECNVVPQVSATAVSENATVTIVQATQNNPTATVTVTSGDQTRIYQVNFSIPTSTTSQMNDAVCQGESYSLNGFNLPAQNSSGTFDFQRTTTNSQGCDSIITLTLTVHPTYNYSTEISICESQLPFSFGGQEFNEAGTYNLSFQTVNQCDSLVTLVLAVGNEYTETLNPILCEGETFEFLDSTYSETGIYNYTIVSSEGCDSVFTINLSVNPNYETLIEETICESQLPFSFGGQEFNEAGTYNLTFQTVNQCDSVFIINLSVNPSYEILIEDSIKQGENYTLNGFNLPAQTELGTFDYQLELTTIAGCDSIVNLALTVVENVAVQELKTETIINIYPNPTRDVVHITSREEIQQIEIFDMTGRLLKSVFGNNNQLSINELNNGIYHIRIKTLQGVEVRKLIKQ